MQLNSTEEIIDDLRQGKMVIIMDDEDRENEGDLIMAAEKVTPDAINFMARFGRGLICLTLTENRCRELRLPLMGQALSHHLLAENQPLVVFNRSLEKCDELKARGAAVATSAQALVEQCDICLLFLSDAKAISSVLDDINTETFKNCLIIQMGTIAPEESRALASRVKTAGGRYLECPVLGSLPEAGSGKLILPKLSL